jgi:hypothetical protein
MTSSPESDPTGTAVADLVALVAPHVLGVSGHRQRLGTAILWAPGVLVTTASAVHRERHPQLVAADGRRVDAEVAGIDPDTDLAALRAPALDVGSPVARGDAPAPRTGDFVFAVAHDAHAGVQASFGRLGAVGGAWRGGRGGAEIEQRLRLDGGLYPGFEGALVADGGGRLLGVATSAFSRVHGVVMPAATVDRVLAALLREGSVPRPYLGVMVQPARRARRRRRDGRWRARFVRRRRRPGRRGRPARRRRACRRRRRSRGRPGCAPSPPARARGGRSARVRARAWRRAPAPADDPGRAPGARRSARSVLQVNRDAAAIGERADVAVLPVRDGADARAQCDALAPGRGVVLLAAHPIDEPTREAIAACGRWACCRRPQAWRS